MSQSTTANSQIEMQFSADEAIALMRALAMAKQRATSDVNYDDLELLRLRIFREIYDRPRAARILSTVGRIRVWDEQGTAA